MKRVVPLSVVLLGLAACTSAPPEPVSITPSNEIRGAAVVRLPIPEPTQPKAPAGPEVAPGGSTAPSADIILPPNTQYVCVSETNGVRQQTSIEFSPKVALLCQKHPEMGPCKYERDACRKSNGRVYAANGVEITRQTEAEYDRKVLRVTFKAN
jgi:hypothetical protein